MTDQRIGVARPPQVYNGTDTAKFKRTPEMAAEALTRYPCATPDNAFVVGCIGSYEERKAQSLLLRAAKLLIDDGRLPNIHCLLVGEGPDKEMLAGLITELGLEAPSLRSLALHPSLITRARLRGAIIAIISITSLAHHTSSASRRTRIVRILYLMLIRSAQTHT